MFHHRGFLRPKGRIPSLPKGTIATYLICLQAKKLRGVQRHTQMMPDPDDGRKTYPDSAFLKAIREGNETTSAIADAVGCTRQAADYRLRQLEEKGDVTKRKIADRLVWSLPDE